MKESKVEFKNRLSLITGPSLEKITESFTLTETLMRASKKGENKGLYFVSSDGSEEFLSYANLLENAKIILKGLRANGIQTSDKVILEIENDKNFFCTFWACILGGIISAPISSPTSFNQDSQELHKILTVWKILEEPIIITDEKNIFDYNELKTNDQYNNLKLLSFQELFAWEKEEVIYYATPDEMAFLQFSSGSTGLPKGVILTHHNLITNIRSICESYNFSFDDVTISWLPHTHDMGLIALHLTSVYCIMNQIKMSPQVFLKKPLNYLKKISEYKATITAMPNFGLSWILEKVKEKDLREIDLSSLRVLSNGAEPISVKTMNAFIEKFKKYGFDKVAMCPNYGMAEASVALCFSPLKEEPMIRKINKDRFYEDGIIVEMNPDNTETILIVDEGYPIPTVGIRIVDDDDNIVKEGIVGHIQVRGPNVTQGYFNNPKANQTLFCDGWLRTGDIGFSIDGRLTVSGRKKDIIIINGMNFYAYDIEEIVYELIKVRRGDVAAVGIQNVDTGTEDIILFVKYKGSIKKFLEFRNQIVKEINRRLGIVINQVIPINKIPKTTSGKTQRYKLKKKYLDKEFENIIVEITAELQKYYHNREDIVDPKNELEMEIRKIWAEVLGTTESQISVVDKFTEIGGNSVKATQVLTHLEDFLDRELSHDILINKDTIKEIAISLEEIDDELDNINQTQKMDRDEDHNYKKEIAVVGISLRLPGSKNIDEFWEHLKSGDNLIDKIQPSRQKLANAKNGMIG